MLGKTAGLRSSRCCSLQSAAASTLTQGMRLESVEQSKLTALCLALPVITVTIYSTHLG